MKVAMELVLVSETAVRREMPDYFLNLCSLLINRKTAYALLYSASRILVIISY